MRTTTNIAFEPAFGATMDANKQKEHFSIAFIRVLAAVAGIYVQEPRDDIESEDLILASKRRFTATSRASEMFGANRTW